VFVPNNLLQAGQIFENKARSLPLPITDAAFALILYMPPNACHGQTLEHIFSQFQWQRKFLKQRFRLLSAVGFVFDNQNVL
jgi:hypothetical protein